MTIYGFNSYSQQYAPASKTEITSDSLIVPRAHELEAGQRYAEYSLAIQRHPWAYGSSSVSIGIAGIIFFIVATLGSAHVIPQSFMALTLTITVLVMLLSVSIGVFLEKRFHWDPLREFKEDLIHRFGAREGFSAELLPPRELDDDVFYEFVDLMDDKRFTERRIERFTAELSRLKRLIAKANAHQRRGTVHESRKETCASLDNAVQRERKRLEELKSAIASLLSGVSL